MKKFYTIKKHKELHNSEIDYAVLFLYFPVYKYEIDSIFLAHLEKKLNKTEINKKLNIIKNSIGLYERIYGKIIL